MALGGWYFGFLADLLLLCGFVLDSGVCALLWLWVVWYGGFTVLWLWVGVARAGGVLWVVTWVVAVVSDQYVLVTGD